MSSKILFLLIILSSAADAITINPYFEADLPNPAVSFTKSKEGTFVEVIVNEWQDTAHTKEGIKKYIFQQGFDYSKHQGFIRTFTPDRILVNETYSAEYDGMVAREELLEAFEIFKSNPEILKILSATDETITLHGGFNYADKQESAACHAGSRCVHVFASIPTNSVLAHAIVKLVDKSVPYPHFDMEQFENNKKEVMQ